MKKILFFGAFMCFINTIAQTSPLDVQLAKVDQSTVISGIIYERSSRAANLYEFNQVKEKPHNTANFRFFEKALAELYRGSNHKRLLSIKELEERIEPDSEITNIVNVGIINTPFQILNYNPERPTEGGLIIKDSVYEQIPNKEPFYTLYALVVAPLKNVVVGEQITYKFSEDLIFNNGEIKIKTLIADLGDGTTRTIIENGSFILQSITVENSKTNGDKKLQFIVELSNGFKITTNGAIYTHYAPASNLRNPLPPFNCNTNSNDPIEDFASTNIKADELFQGLNEGVALKGQIQARVFYRTQNQNTTKTLMKPILVVDGFDPGDIRKMQDCDCENDPSGNCQEANKSTVTGAYSPEEHVSLYEQMEYKDTYITPNLDKNLVIILRSKGYDVILVNEPTYYSAGIKIDGGSDFVERNAMAYVKLTQQVNSLLKTNGSTEKLVAVGPSMGGQITRYALAFMEKKEAEATTQVEKDKWKHNTRIWVAFDSPNHGANVPLGNQALIKLLAEDSPDAEKLYNEGLNSPASKEMMIDLHKQADPVYSTIFPSLITNPYAVNNSYLNGSTISQGMPTDAGNPFFQEHYNHQFNNGLPNSKGFPMNLRKLAVVNGSLKGASFGSDLQPILDVRLFTQICIHPLSSPLGGLFGINPDWGPTICYSQKLAQMQTWTMPAPGNYGRIAYKLKGSDGNHYNSTNYNSRGNMDIVSGGALNSTEKLYKKIVGVGIPSRSFWEYPWASFEYWYTNIFGNGTEWETRVLEPNQCFIPTYSAIGIKNPNQNWGNPLNRNLVCDPNNKEIYFDSYFGEAENTEHVKLNIRSVNWLLKELGDNTHPPVPQAPWFPIDISALDGPAIICINANATYSFPDICKLPSAVTWSVTSNAQIVNPTDYSVQIIGLANGPATITATFQNGQTFTKNIWVGKPILDFEIETNTPNVLSTIIYLTGGNGTNINHQGISSTVWTKDTTSAGTFSGHDFQGYAHTVQL